MNVSDDDRSEMPPSADHPRPFQFSLRAVLSVVTACCVAFGIFAAAGPDRSGEIICLLVVLAVIAVPASQFKGGLRWLIGGASVGTVGGVLIGAALIASAYGPVDKQFASRGFWGIAYTGFIAGGLAGLLFMNAPKPVSFAGSAGMIVVVAGCIFYLWLSGPREFYSDSVEGVVTVVAGAVVAGGALGMIAGSLQRDSVGLLYLGVFLLARVLLGSCCLFPQVHR